LVLLHDFPEFLSEYYFSLCDAIPARCAQMRNIVLSAYHPEISLPDPHLRNMNFENIPEMGPIPPILSDFTTGLKVGDLRTNLDQYLSGRANPSFILSLKDRLKLPPTSNMPHDSYNVPLIDALVIYVGVSSVAQAKTKSGSSLFSQSDPGVVMLQQLANELDAEGALELIFNSFYSYNFRAILASEFYDVALALPERTYSLVYLSSLPPFR
jgi:CCR4-NOT transcription complex subunit 1